MQRVLLSFDYPQLYSLSLADFQEEMLFQYLTGKLFCFVYFN
jgi:hypothetical protein